MPGAAHIYIFINTGLYNETGPCQEQHVLLVQGSGAGRGNKRVATSHLQWQTGLDFTPCESIWIETVTDDTRLTRHFNAFFSPFIFIFHPEERNVDVVEAVNKMELSRFPKFRLCATKCCWPRVVPVWQSGAHPCPSLPELPSRVCFGALHNPVFNCPCPK